MCFDVLDFQGQSLFNMLDNEMYELQDRGL